MFGAEAIALMNTGRPGHPDRLDERWLATALAQWSVGPWGVAHGSVAHGSGVQRGRITADDLDELRRLRTMLRRWAAVVAAGELLSTEDLGDLNRLLARTPSSSRVLVDGERYVLDMTPVAADWRDVAIAEILGSFAAMLRADPTRLRICAAPGCGTVFRDETRSRTRSWCDNRTCGNRVRVHRHRTGGP